MATTIVGTPQERTKAIAKMLEFLEAVHECFPECKKCEDALGDFRDMVVGDEATEDRACREWLTPLCGPLPAALACYVAPLRRILGVDPIMYYAVAYSDGDTLVKSGCIALVNHLDLGSKWNDPDFVDDRYAMMVYIQQITTLVLRYMHAPTLGPEPPVPSQEDIQEEVRRFAAQNRPQNGVTQAFQATFEGVVGLLLAYGGDDDPPECPPFSHAWEADWDTVRDREDFFALCEARDERVLAMLETTSVPGFVHARASYARMGDPRTADPADRQHLWQQLTNLAGFSIVAQIMPAGMRSKLEEIAANLNDRTENSSFKLSDMDQSQMLELAFSIMETTTNEEMQAAASQLDKIVPIALNMTNQLDTSRLGVDTNALRDILDLAR